MTHSLATAAKSTLRLAFAAGAATLLAGCMGGPTARSSHDFPPDYRQRHPILVGPQGAYVATTCGQWPHDLGTADVRRDMANTAHYNHGCATQANFAAMVANPNDLLQPRAEGEIDAARRQTIVGRYRRGESPGPHTVHDPMLPLTAIRTESKR